jgi:alpha-galactosidase
LLEPTALRIGDNRYPFSEGRQRAGGLELACDREDRGGRATLVRLRVRNPGDHERSLPDITVELDPARGQVLEHGWQSWSVVRRSSASDVRPLRAKTARWERARLLTAPGLAGEAVVGEPFLVSEDGVAGFLAGGANFAIVAASPGRLDAISLLDGVPLGPGEERELEPLWLGPGDPGRRYSDFADAWGQSQGARSTTRAPLGWCSWYQYFGKVTPADIRANIGPAQALGIEVFQIDDGYQAAIGDWLDPMAGWEGQLEELSREIRAAGMTPGIWTAPFLAAEDSRLASEHPDWLLRGPSGDPVRAERNWGRWILALDATNNGFLSHLGYVFGRLVELGFTYHKIDFCYAGAIGADGAPRSSTRAQALRSGLTAIRQGIGDDAFLLGCGCPFGPAIGLVDAMRVSADTAPRWDLSQRWLDDPEMTGFEEHPPSGRNAVEATVLRAPLHRRLWVNDPDCLMVRHFDTDLTSQQIDLMAATIAGTGGFVVISDDCSRYGAAEHDLLGKVRSLSGPADTPLEIADPFAEALEVTSRASVLAVDWDGRSEPPPSPGAGSGVIDATGPAGLAWARLDR